ncbi:hypothetical protein DITRI_Ditri17bG0033000 [Diplodiscus trichospermus]
MALYKVDHGVALDMVGEEVCRLSVMVEDLESRISDCHCCSHYLFNEQELIGAVIGPIVCVISEEKGCEGVDVVGPFSGPRLNYCRCAQDLIEKGEADKLGPLESIQALDLSDGTVVPLSIDGSSLEIGRIKGKRKKRMVDIYGQASNGTPSGRGRRRAKQELLETIKTGQEEAGVGFDESLSDEDIAHRNVIIRKETEATWEVSALLRLVFNKNKSQMIEVFQRMEELDMEERAI